MLLTKLEIKGFKSFGDKVVINFDEGVTGIVGQNGCGKSNVVDAIRWVLGEQKTKALRSDKMENIIFNGTKKRKPLHLAEVSLTFKNTKNIIATEYSEVTITRRLYRSGESEYLLNGVTCRLKDITNLFLDTGIGSDSYAIIELKMVDEILNDKENSRRNLFEEAAGISKFKIRKKETLKKLEDADQDLARVEDLLFELDKQLKTLEKQAKRTEKYYKTKEEYKGASIELAKKSVADKQNLMLHLAKQITQESDEKLLLQKLLLEKETFIEQGKTAYLLKEKTLQSRQKALNEFVNDIRQYENEKKIKNERLKMLREQNQVLKEQIIQDQQREQEFTHQISNFGLERSNAEKILKEFWFNLENLKGELEIQKEQTSQLQTENKNFGNELNQKQNLLFSLSKDFEVKQSQKAGIQQEIAKSKTENNQYNENLVIFQEQQEQAQEELVELKETLANLQNDENEQKNRLQDLLNENDELKEKQIAKNRILDAKTNEYQLTKSMLENLEGFPEAVQFLSKSPDFQDKNILLADIFTCEESYKAPLEAFLDNLLNFYVLESLEQAIKAVDLLYTAQKGKANFFILENIKPTTQVLAIPDTQKATSLIICEEKYKKLFEYLLENVFICEEQDLPELQKKHLDCTFISKNAKIISRSASISGGSVSSYEGKHIGRKQQLEVLEQEIQTLSEEISELKENMAEKQAEIQELKNNSLAEEIRETQVLYHKKNEQFITLRTKTEQIQNLIEHSEEKNETLLNRLEQLASETEDLQPQINDLEKLVKELQEKLNNHSDLLAKANDLLSQKSGVFNQENLKYHQQENRVKSIEQELKFNESSLEALRNRLSKNNDEILRITNEIDILENTAETFDDKLFEMYQEKESMEKGLNEAEKDYYAQRGEIERNEKEIRELQRKKENIDIVINEIQNKINETKLSFASTKERLSVEFNVDLEALMSEENTLVSEKTEEELKTEVQRLKNVLDTIGAINPMAMEAYQEIKERNDFIIAQKDDLLKAKNALLETIEEIDTVAKENFLTTFEAIRTNFQKVFRSLFTEEDTCDLILLKPENPLESPIDIVAKPKGKRPLTINQLSGGEKTLTATSLLFAIYLIKPAPFCIFDEVDAPLDDANVDKFTKIIRKFSEQSQFIIVTHNKRTMAATDIMYGVTMYPEDPGVSKLVPVDLRNLQEEFVSN